MNVSLTVRLTRRSSPRWRVGFPTMRSRRPRLLVLALVVAFGAAGCGGDEPSSPAPGTASTRPPSHAAVLPPASIPPGVGAVTSFTVTPPASCRAGEPTTATATYTTTDAAKVAFLVDQNPAPGETPVSGTLGVPVPCDGAVHTVVLTAAAADGRSSLQSRAVAMPEPTAP